MADQTITERTRSSHGQLIKETGKFTASGTSDLQIVTDLSWLVWAKISAAGATNRNDIEFYINSNDNTGNDETDDGGIIHIESNVVAEDYWYEAIGRP